MHADLNFVFLWKSVLLHISMKEQKNTVQYQARWH